LTTGDFKVLADLGYTFYLTHLTLVSLDTSEHRHRCIDVNAFEWMPQPRRCQMGWCQTSQRSHNDNTV